MFFIYWECKCQCYFVPLVNFSRNSVDGILLEDLSEKLVFSNIVQGTGFLTTIKWLIFLNSRLKIDQWQGGKYPAKDVLCCMRQCCSKAVQNRHHFYRLNLKNLPHYMKLPSNKSTFLLSHIFTFLPIFQIVFFISILKIPVLEQIHVQRAERLQFWSFLVNLFSLWLSSMLLIAAVL